LGAVVAQKFAAEGCNIAINYVGNHDRAKQTAQKLEKEYGTKMVVIQGVCFSSAETSLLARPNILARTWGYWQTVSGPSRRA